MFEFDEFASGAPSWYAGVTKAFEDNDIAGAQRLAQEALDKTRETASCLALANACLAAGDSFGARRLAEEAFTNAKAKPAEAAAQHLLGKILVRDRKFNEAETHLTAAMGVYSEISNEDGRLAVLLTSSKCKQDVAEAMDAISEVLESFKGRGNTRGTAAAMYAMLNRKLSAGQTDQAVIVADEIVKLYEQARDPDGEISARLLAGQVYLATGNFQDAIQLTKAAAQSYNDGKKKARAVNTLANVLRIAGMYKDAHKAAEAAFTLSRDSSDKRGQAAALCMTATICDTEKDYGKAAYKLERASKLYKQLKDHKEEAQTLESVASMQLKVFAMLDDANEPEKVCQRAMNLYKSLNMDQSAECGYLTQTLGFAFLAQGKQDEALEQLEQSVGIFQAIGNAAGEAAGYNKMAQIYWSLSQKDEAVKMASKGVRIAADNGDLEEAAWGNQLIQQYTGGKVTEEAEGEMTGLQKAMTMQSRGIEQNIFMYVGGRDYCLFMGGIWRGAPAATQGGRRQSSSRQGPEAIEDEGAGGEKVSGVNIDWQGLSQV